MKKMLKDKQFCHVILNVNGKLFDAYKIMLTLRLHFEIELTYLANAFWLYLLLNFQYDKKHIKGKIITRTK